MIKLKQLKRKTHPLRLRMVRTYLLVILVCTLLLFSISLISLVQQQYIIRESSRSNLEMLSQSIAEGLEQRIQSIAAETLGKKWIDSLGYRPGDELIPEKARQLQLKFDELRGAYPIAEEVFIFFLEGRRSFPPSVSIAVRLAEESALARQSIPGPERISPEPYRIDSRSYRSGARISQMYYAVLPGGKPSETAAAGFTVSLPWVRDHLLPEFHGQLGQSISIELMDDMAQAERSSDIYASLPKTGWKLRIPAASIHGTEDRANRELWFIGVATGMFLCVLGMGIYLLVRVSWDIRWYQIRSDFVSGISHDLKTPLSLIRLYSETLSDDEHGFPPEERKNFLRIILRESQRLTRLIDNILDFSSIEQGRKRYALQEGNLAATVKQIVEEYSDYLCLRGFSVKTGIQPDVPPVNFSQEQVSQAILNLMDNARKYSGDSRLIRVHLWRLDGHIVVEVQDYGVGIPPDELDNIFQPFYRVPNQNEKGGCGLGLYLVAQVVQGHKGKIEVESEVGKGSRFRLYFPVVQT
jgi:signal transduction histidine kinase